MRVAIVTMVLVFSGVQQIYEPVFIGMLDAYKIRDTRDSIINAEKLPNAEKISSEYFNFILSRKRA